MEIKYTPSLKSYFKCRFPDNETDLYDCVQAIADGALTLFRKKDSNPGKSVWSKQKACFLFEAKRLSVTTQQLENIAKGLPKSWPRCCVLSAIVSILKLGSNWRF